MSVLAQPVCNDASIRIKCHVCVEVTRNILEEEGPGPAHRGSAVGQRADNVLQLEGHVGAGLGNEIICQASQPEEGIGRAALPAIPAPYLSHDTTVQAHAFGLREVVFDAWGCIV